MATGDSEEIEQKRLAQLAARGLGSVRTNPTVGCILYGSDKVEAEGWHTAYGEDHAERMAVKKWQKKMDPSVKMSAYVSLEPCNHQGKTPPCTDLFDHKNCRQLSYWVQDPNPKMQGASKSLLEKKGVPTHKKAPASLLHKTSLPFVIQQREKRPFVILKWARSQDGFLAKRNEQTKITNRITDIWVHKLRSQVDGILIGKNTLLMDNPQLNNRHWAGKSPKSFVLTRAPIDNFPEYNLGKTGGQVIHNSEYPQSLQSLGIPDTKDLKYVLDYLYRTQNIGTLLVEGGAQILNSFLSFGLFDQIYEIVNEDLMLEVGTKAPTPRVQLKDSAKIRSDRFRTYTTQRALK